MTMLTEMGMAHDARRRKAEEELVYLAWREDRLEAIRKHDEEGHGHRLAQAAAEQADAIARQEICAFQHSLAARVAACNAQSDTNRSIFGDDCDASVTLRFI